MLETRQFCDIEFVVGPDENSMRIPAHVALVAARSQWLRTRIRQAKEARDKHLEKVKAEDLCYKIDISYKSIIDLLGFWFFFCAIQRLTASGSAIKGSRPRSI